MSQPPVADRYALQDPRYQYPRPPFPAQRQAAPGLVSAMQPTPDHGERSYHGSGRLLGRKALITGGDSGIGRAGAIAFAREGADVAINYLPSEQSDAQAVLDLIEAAGRKAVAVPGNIADESSCKVIVGTAVKQLQGLDLLMINAGHQHYAHTLHDLSSEQFDQTMKTNVYGAFWTAKVALTHMPAGSSIIISSSLQASRPSEGLLDYAASKAALRAMTQSLAKQAIARGLRVNAIAPGPVWTPMIVSSGEPEDKIINFGSDTPMGRPAQPVEMSGLLVFLASPESSYCTGDVFGITGGLSST